MQIYREVFLPSGRLARPILCGTLLLIHGCPGGAGPALTDSRRVPPVVEVRDVRVLIASTTDSVRFQVNGRHRVLAGNGAAIEYPQRNGWTEVTGRGGLHVGGTLLDQRRVEIIPARGATFEFSRRKGGKWTPATRYAGRLTLLLEPGGRVLAINSLDVDIYVAGVLTRELYPDFHAEAYRAQAVASRTYALHQMSRMTGREYDVTATEASQVYGGLAQGSSARRAIEAARYTRGIVCTWTSPAGERIFCTYYSSACGGMSQAVADCKSVPSIPPLAGGVRCNYCRIARGQVYRWGPVRLGKSEVTKRLAARFRSVADLGAVRQLDVVGRTRHGRPTRIRLTGSTGRTAELVAEDFRLAVGSRTVRSTDCRIHESGDQFVFSNGRGFGHGIGLCQWGMQGQALAGRKAGEILKYYYTGANLTRAY